MVVLAAVVRSGPVHSDLAEFNGRGRMAAVNVFVFVFFLQFINDPNQMGSEKIICALVNINLLRLLISSLTNISSHLSWDFIANYI